MNIDPLEKFRNDFFDKLIKEEKAKQNAIMLAQKNCFHKYDLQGDMTSNGYQERTCSKCGHTAFKSVRIWEGTKNCIIS